jgi:hypothetical protein
MLVYVERSPDPLSLLLLLGCRDAVGKVWGSSGSQTGGCPFDLLSLSARRVDVVL